MTGPDSTHHWLEVARSIQGDADEAGVGEPPPKLLHPTGDERTALERFDEFVTSEPLRYASRSLYADGYYARAVEEAFKCLNNAVKGRSGITQQDGARLMKTAFSANTPILILNAFQSKSDRDEQQGYMELFSGSMTGIRNPRAHEEGLEDTQKTALELLVLANHLMCKLQAATKSAPKLSDT